MDAAWIAEEADAHGSSSRREFHPPALSDPRMKLSLHGALIPHRPTDQIFINPPERELPPVGKNSAGSLGQDLSHPESSPRSSAQSRPTWLALTSLPPPAEFGPAA